jgi:hypothetical protein
LIDTSTLSPGRARSALMELKLDMAPSAGTSADQRFTLAPTTAAASTALQFDGITNYIEVDCAFPFTTQVTIEAWMRGVPKDAFLFYATTSARTARLFTAHVPYSDGTVYFDGGGDTNDTYDRINKAVSPADDKSTWNHWAFVRDSLAGRMAVYRNGALWHEAATGKTRSMAGCTRLVIGVDWVCNWRHSGAISELRVWSVVRSATEIKDNMNRRAAVGTGLIAAYSLDQATATITDRTGNGPNGLLRGSPVTAAGPTSLV